MNMMIADHADHDIQWLAKPDFWKKQNWRPVFESNRPKSDPK